MYDVVIYRRFLEVIIEIIRENRFRFIMLKKKRNEKAVLVVIIMTKKIRGIERVTLKQMWLKYINGNDGCQCDKPERLEKVQVEY